MNAQHCHPRGGRPTDLSGGGTHRPQAPLTSIARYARPRDSPVCQKLKFIPSRTVVIPTVNGSLDVHTRSCTSTEVRDVL